MKKSKTFYVYILRIMRNGPAVYVGMTTDPKERLSRHMATRVFDSWPSMEIVSRHRTKAVALKREARLIKRLKPPMNAPYVHQNCGHNLSPDEAVMVWFGNPEKLNKEVVEEMPGWTFSTAMHWFGARRRNGEPVPLDEAIERYEAMQDKGVPVRDKRQAEYVLGKSGRGN